MPVMRNMVIWKGNTFERVFAFKNADGTPTQMAGSDFVFRIIWAGGELRKTVGFGLTFDAATGRVGLAITALETRLIPTGENAAKYEFERRVGAWQGSLLYGSITAKEWANDD